MKERFARFTNLPELKALFRSFTDVVQSKDLKVKRPSLRAGGAPKPSRGCSTRIPNSTW